MLAASVERDPHQLRHLVSVAMLACSTNILLDYSVLPGAQAAKEHPHPSVPKQPVSAVAVNLLS